MKIAKIPTSTRNFFYHWVDFTTPFHKLGKTEKKVLAEFLYYRHLLSIEVSSDRLLYKLLFDYSTKKKICDKLDLPTTRISSVLGTLKKSKIVVKGRIDPNFIPNLEVGEKEFVLAFKFMIKGNEEGVYKKKGRKKVS